MCSCLHPVPPSPGAQPFHLGDPQGLRITIESPKLGHLVSHPPSSSSLKKFSSFPRQPRPRPPRFPSGRMTTIKALPYETISRVFALVEEKATLCRATLVCEDWTEPAPEELWKDVEIASSNALVKFVISPRNVRRKRGRGLATSDGANKR